MAAIFDVQGPRRVIVALGILKQLPITRAALYELSVAVAPQLSCCKLYCGLSDHGSTHGGNSHGSHRVLMYRPCQT